MRRAPVEDSVSRTLSRQTPGWLVSQTVTGFAQSAHHANDDDHAGLPCCLLGNESEAESRADRSGAEKLSLARVLNLWCAVDAAAPDDHFGHHTTALARSRDQGDLQA